MVSFWNTCAKLAYIALLITTVVIVFHFGFPVAVLVFLVAFLAIYILEESTPGPTLQKLEIPSPNNFFDIGTSGTSTSRTISACIPLQHVSTAQVQVSSALPLLESERIPLSTNTGETLQELERGDMGYRYLGTINDIEEDLPPEYDPPPPYDQIC